MPQIISYLNRLKGERADLVYLLVAKSKGHDAWFILEIERTTKPIFYETMKHDLVDLTKYGRVLFSGWGTEPPENIVKQLETEYQG